MNEISYLLHKTALYCSDYVLISFTFEYSHYSQDVSDSNNIIIFVWDLFVSFQTISVMDY